MIAPWSYGDAIIGNFHKKWCVGIVKSFESVLDICLSHTASVFSVTHKFPGAPRAYRDVIINKFFWKWRLRFANDTRTCTIFIGIASPLVFSATRQIFWVSKHRCRQPSTIFAGNNVWVSQKNWRSDLAFPTSHLLCLFGNSPNFPGTKWAFTDVLIRNFHRN